MRRLLTILLSLLTFWLGGVTGTPRAEESVSPRDLVFEIIPSKSAYVQYEPVTVAYRVRNPTAETITAWIVIEHITDDIKFWIEDSAGGRMPAGGGGLACVAPGAPDEIAPGGFVLSDTLLYWNAKAAGYTFPDPDRYTIHGQITLRGPRITLAADPVTVEIESPGEADRRAIHFFHTEDEFLEAMASAYQFCRDRSASDGFDRLESFLDLHSDSAYAPFIALDLASGLKSGIIKVESAPRLAIELYRLFLDQWPTHPLAWRAMYALAFALRDAGAIQEAVRTVAQFESSFPERSRQIRQLRWSVSLDREYP